MRVGSGVYIFGIWGKGLVGGGLGIDLFVRCFILDRKRVGGGCIKEFCVVEDRVGWGM